MIEKKRRDYFITTNYHWIQDEYQKSIEAPRILELLFNKGCEYAIYCFEIGKENNRPHSHWYIKFRNARAFKPIQKIFSSSNIKPREKTVKNCIDYIKKDGNFTERGEPPKQGERKDLQALADDILAGRTTCGEILNNEAYTYHSYGRTLEKIEDAYLRSTKRTVATRGLWLYGGTGVGKSSRAFNEHEDAYWKSVASKEVGWWDGYRGERTVVIDEFRGEIPFSFMLRLMDRYPLWVSRRCREPFPFTSEKILVTSRYHPRHVYKDQTNEEMKQLYRRCDIIKLMKDSIKCVAGVPVYATKPIEDRERIEIDGKIKLFC